METYTFLRELADSWVMLGIFGFFIGAAIWAFLPSQNSARKDASMIPFRNEKPAKARTEKGADGQSSPSSSDQKGA